MIGRIVASAGIVLALAVLGCKPGSPAPEPEEKAPSAGAASLKTQETCPVMGDKLDKSLFVDHEGKRVYFCCGMCVEKFKKDPAKYLKVLSDRGEAPIDVPAGE